MLFWISRFFERLWRWYKNRVACQHFCLYKKAGSNFKNCHVHILVKGEYKANSNPDMYTGVGHDDATPGMGNPGDPQHNSVSKGSKCEFRTKPDGTALSPLDLQALSIDQGYFYPGPEDGECAEGYQRVHCPCGDMCVTWDYESWEKWRKTQ